MKTEVGRNWYQTILFYKLSNWQVSFSRPPNGHHHERIINVFSVFNTF
jgi:hypothetical protein